jgi:hypothetical protein
MKYLADLILCIGDEGGEFQVPSPLPTSKGGKSGSNKKKEKTASTINDKTTASAQVIEEGGD